VITVQPLPFTRLALILGAVDRGTRKAVSRAINESLKNARLDLQADLSDYFTIRNNRTARGFRIGFASPEGLTGWIGHLDRFMDAQTFGGVKTPKDAPAIGVPLRVRKPKSLMTPPKTWPKRYLKQKDAFIDNGKTLYARDGTNKRGPLLPMWNLLKRVRIKSRWPMEKLVKSSVSRTFPAFLKTEMKALEGEASKSK